MRFLIPLTAALLSYAAAAGQVRPLGSKPAKPAPKAAAARPAAGPSASPAAAPAPAAPAPAAPVRETFAVTVSGSITNADGLPLPGATVWNSTTHQILAVTNSQGEFTLNLPTNNAVTLTCGYAGFSDQQIRIRQPHRNNDLSITLEPVTAPKTR